jgi:signal peptidase I
MVSTRPGSIPAAFNLVAQRSFMSRINVVVRRAWQMPLVQFGFFFLMILASRSAIADWNYVPTGSMKPTILEGDLVWVNRLAYDLKVPFTTWHMAEWDEPGRGDIVVAYSPEDGDRIIKRVVAIPGDEIEIVGQTLLINGHRPAFGPVPQAAISGLENNDLMSHGFAIETLLGHARTVMYGQQLASPTLVGPYTIPTGHYFLMGDHRNNSRDSRFYGAVSRDQILGRATHVIGSVNIRSTWSPRWERFFESMET